MDTQIALHNMQGWEVSDGKRSGRTSKETASSTPVIASDQTHRIRLSFNSGMLKFSVRHPIWVKPRTNFRFVRPLQLPEPDFFHQLIEPRITAQGLVTRIHIEEN